MQKNKKLKSDRVFWSLLPLVIFIAADIFLDTTLSVLVSILSGIIILIIIYIIDRKVDKLLTLDVIFLSILGAISIFVNNDVFLKLKPGIIQLFLIVYIGFYAFANNNIFKDFLNRISLGRFKITEEIQANFRKTLRWLFYALIPHTLLVFYSAIYISLSLSMLISTIGLIMIVVFIAFIPLIKRFWQNRSIEFVPVVDNEGKIIGKASREYCHNGINKVLHPVVHMHILNSKGEIFLQKRSLSAKVQPGKWDAAVGGHVKWNESIEKALNRETYEETKLRPDHPKMFARYIWNSDIESELVFSFLQHTDKQPQINHREAEEGKWWSFDEIKSTSQTIFTSNFLQEFKILVKIFSEKNKGK